MIQRDPAGSAFKLSPKGSAGSLFFFNDGIDTATCDAANFFGVYTCAFANVQGLGSDPNQIRDEVFVSRSFCGSLRCNHRQVFSADWTVDSVGMRLVFVDDHSIIIRDFRNVPVLPFYPIRDRLAGVVDGIVGNRNKVSDMNSINRY